MGEGGGLARGAEEFGVPLFPVATIFGAFFYPSRFAFRSNPSNSARRMGFHEQFSEGAVSATLRVIP